MSRKTIERNISYDDVKKKYYVNMDYGKDENGRRIKKSLSFNTKAEAKNALRKFEGNKVADNLVIPNEMTLQNWLNYWMDNVIKPNRAETTIYGYTQMINNHIIPSIGRIALQKLSAKTLQEYYKTKMNNADHPLSSNSVRKHHDLLKTSLALAVKQELLLRNPADLVEPPKTINSEKKYYTVDELSRLFDLIEGDRLELVVKLAGYLGLRREEICGLIWENIDFANKILYIRKAMTVAGSKVIFKNTKTESSIRTLAIPDELLECLKKEKDKQIKNKSDIDNYYNDIDFVISWEDGRPYRPNYLSELFTDFIIKNNLPKIVLHELRHTFASIANAQGVSLFNIGKALGHSTPSTTGKVYTHLFDKKNEETILSISKALKFSNK